MAQQIPLFSPETAKLADPDATVHEIAPDLAYRRLGLVNVVFFGNPRAGDRGWILIDAGVRGTASLIRSAAAERFGENARPAAIAMTHAHFDHVGALEELSEEWDVPVIAHSRERPFLDGSECYPPADPSVGGGLMALMSPLYPRRPVDVGDRLQSLPENGTVPGMPGWRWIHTPGHTPGHVSFWRESDRSLIAGDAFITTAQESAYAVLTQKPELHGPPRYFTPDWKAAGDSVRNLAALEPERAITGHGRALHGPELRTALHRLADEFESVAVPRRS